MYSGNMQQTTATTTTTTTTNTTKNTNIISKNNKIIDNNTNARNNNYIDIRNDSRDNSRSNHRKMKLGDRIEWSRETILGFIEDYKRERVLWDPNCKGYHIKQIKYEALKALGFKYGAEIRAIRSKIKSLRSSFHREHGKVINGRRRGVNYQPVWFAYEAIRFILEDNFVGTATDGNTLSFLTITESGSKHDDDSHSSINENFNIAQADAACKANTTITAIKSTTATLTQESFDNVSDLLFATQQNCNLQNDDLEKRNLNIFEEKEDTKPYVRKKQRLNPNKRSATFNANKHNCNNNNISNSNNNNNNNNSNHNFAFKRDTAIIDHEPVWQLAMNTNEIIGKTLKDSLFNVDDGAVKKSTTTTATTIAKTAALNHLSKAQIHHFECSSEAQIGYNIRPEDIKTEIMENDGQQHIENQIAKSVTDINHIKNYIIEDSINNKLHCNYKSVQNTDNSNDINNVNDNNNNNNNEHKIIPITTNTNNLISNHDNQPGEQNCFNTTRKRKSVDICDIMQKSPMLKYQRQKQQNAMQHSNNKNSNNINNNNNNNNTFCLPEAASVYENQNVKSSDSSSQTNFETNSAAADEYNIFGDYVAITIRKLKTSKAKIVVKHIINNLLYEAEMGKYDLGMPASRDPPQLYKM